MCLMSSFSLSDQFISLMDENITVFRSLYIEVLFFSFKPDLYSQVTENIFHTSLDKYAYHIVNINHIAIVLNSRTDWTFCIHVPNYTQLQSIVCFICYCQIHNRIIYADLIIHVIYIKYLIYVANIYTCMGHMRTHWYQSHKEACTHICHTSLNKYVCTLHKYNPQHCYL